MLRKVTFVCLIISGLILTTVFATRSSSLMFTYMKKKKKKNKKKWCPPGYGMVQKMVQEWKKDCVKKYGKPKWNWGYITNFDKCKKAYKNVKSMVDKNVEFRDWNKAYYKTEPPGCYWSKSQNTIRYNKNLKSKKGCWQEGKCICQQTTCVKCPRGTYSQGKDTYSQDNNGACKKCKAPKVTNDKQTKCTNEYVIIGSQINKLQEQKNEISLKNNRLWAKEQIRLKHDKMMQKRKQKDDKDITNYCKHERQDGTVVMPSILLEDEMENGEDTTCIDTNRKELLQSFCNFRADLDNLFQIEGIDMEAKSFWPNICCKERRDKSMSVCEDKSGKIKRENIIPFALSQGGEYSRHTLYAEVAETIKKKGYLHNGMIKLINSLRNIQRSKKAKLKSYIDTFFNGVSLCGPRVLDVPGKNEGKLCQLFIPYEHSISQFYNLIETSYMQPLPLQSSSSLLETMENSLRKRSTTSTHDGKTNTIQQIIAAKPSVKPPKAEEQCKHIDAGSKWTSRELSKMKEMYCTGYSHLDLSNNNIENVAIYYLENDIAFNSKEMVTLKHSIRFDIKDNSCPASPLFTANDISIQRVAMDALGKKKEWAAVVQLNTKRDNSYLQSELPYCKVKEYLIGAKVTVKAYVDSTQCCDGWKDYNKCKTKQTCMGKLKPLSVNHNNNKEEYSKDVILTGTQYSVENTDLSSKRRRRRLLSLDGGINKVGC